MKYAIPNTTCKNNNIKADIITLDLYIDFLVAGVDKIILKFLFAYSTLKMIAQYTLAIIGNIFIFGVIAVVNKFDRKVYGVSRVMDVYIEFETPSVLRTVFLRHLDFLQGFMLRN